VHVYLAIPPSAEAIVENFRYYYGPTLKAFEALEFKGQDEALARDFEELIEEWNTSGDETVVVPSYYLEAVATSR
jgi:hypothetical protein